MKLKELIETADGKAVFAIQEYDENHNDCWVGTFPPTKIAESYSKYETAEVVRWSAVEDEDGCFIRVLVK